MLPIALDSRPLEHMQNARAPRWTAECVGAVKLREKHPFRCHPFEMGGACSRMTVNGQISVSQIIGEEEDDVGLAGNGRYSRKHKRYGDPQSSPFSHRRPLNYSNHGDFFFSYITGGRCSYCPNKLARTKNEKRFIEQSNVVHFIKGMVHYGQKRCSSQRQVTIITNFTTILDVKKISAKVSFQVRVSDILEIPFVFCSDCIHDEL